VEGVLRPGALLSLLVSLLPMVVPEAVPAASVPPRLAARARAGGAVSVMVELATPFTPEGGLTPGSRARQRAGIDAVASALLAELAAGSSVPRHRYASVPFLALRVGPAGLARLAASPRVRAVREDRVFALALDTSVPSVDADSLPPLGIDGTGQTLAVIDSGVNGEHPNLAGKVVGEACFSGRGPGQTGDCPNGRKSQIGSGAGVPCTFHADCFHGTHVAGIASASLPPPNWPGVAPAATLISIRVATLETSALLCSPAPAPCLVVVESDMLAGLELVYDDFRHDHDVAAVNLSIAGATYSSQSTCDAANSAFKAAIDNLRSVGIATVAAAGNGGEADAIGEPACISSALSVSATNDGVTVPTWANRAPFLSLWAPGVAVRAPDYLGVGYRYASGTSMAAPHVAGALALLRQAAPGASVDELLAALQTTGEPIPASSGDGTRIRVLAAYQALTPDCDDGIDDDGDGLLDLADPGCADASDDSERGSLPCDDGVDDDADGWADFPADPGCADALFPLEDPRCQDGADNDGDGKVDFDGGASLHGGVPVADPDPQCGSPSLDREGAGSCGLGFELAPALGMLALALARRRATRLR
jgi:subtilisin